MLIFLPISDTSETGQVEVSELVRRSGDDKMIEKLAAAISKAQANKPSTSTGKGKKKETSSASSTSGSSVSRESSKRTLTMPSEDSPAKKRGRPRKSAGKYELNLKPRVFGQW